MHMVSIIVKLFMCILLFILRTTDLPHKMWESWLIKLGYFEEKNSSFIL